MKKAKPYWPYSDNDLAVWNSNYGENISINGQLLGLTAAEVTEQEQASSLIVSAVNSAEAKRAQVQEATAYKNRIIKEQGSIIRQCIARMKTHASYTEDIGRDLGIVSIPSIVDLKTVKPELKLTAFPGYVSIAFTKYGLEGVVIYCRLKGTLGWDKLGTDFASPFLDKRPLAVANQPELREYMAQYTNLRETIGQQSDIATLVFGG